MNSKLISPSERSLLLRLRKAGCPVEVPWFTYPLSVSVVQSTLGPQVFPYGDAVVLAVLLRMVAFRDIRLREMLVDGEWFPHGGSVVDLCEKHTRYCIHQTCGSLSWVRGAVLNELAYGWIELKANTKQNRWLLLTFPRLPEAPPSNLSITVVFFDHYGVKHPFPLSLKYGVEKVPKVVAKTEVDEVI